MEKRMTNRELIKRLLDVPLDKEVLLCYPKEHIDDMGEECIIIPMRLIRNVSYEIPYDSASVGHITIEVVADWRLR